MCSVLLNLPFRAVRSPLLANYLRQNNFRPYYPPPPPRKQGENTPLGELVVPFRPLSFYPHVKVAIFARNPRCAFGKRRVVDTCIYVPVEFEQTIR